MQMESLAFLLGKIQVSCFFSSGTKASKINLMCAMVWSVPKRCSTRTVSSSGGSSKTSSRLPPSTSQAFHLCDSQWLTISPGLLVIPNVSNSVSEKIICKKDSDFVLFRWILHQLRIPHLITCRRHLESSKHFSDWCGKHLTTKKPLDHEMFVSVVTRLNGLYVLVETPQQNTDSAVQDEGGEEVSKNDLRHIQI